MIKAGVWALGIGWAVCYGIGAGLIAQDSRLGWIPLILFGVAAMLGATAIDQPEQRGQRVLLLVAGFGSDLLYTLFRVVFFAMGGG